MNIKKHMKRNLVIMLTVLSVIGGSAALIAGGSEENAILAQENQTWTVQRGNLSLEITAAGNLDLAQTEDLAIDLFYQEGTVEEVLVEEGDTVEEGQVLARLDTDEWNDELSTLKKAVDTAQRNLTSKQSALTKAERKVVTLERQVADKESAVAEAEREIAAKDLAVRQAELDVETAEYNLSQIEEVKEAQDAVDDAEEYLRLIKIVKTGGLAGALNIDYAYWTQQEVLAEQELEWAEEDLQEILEDTGFAVSGDLALEIAKKQLLVEKARMNLEDAELATADAQKAVDDAQYALESAQLDVKDAEQDVEDAGLDVEDAEQNLSDAEEDLAAAQSKSPEIKATFTGFVTRVNVEGGDEVMKGTVAVQIANPNKFEADISVSELDISQVEEGGEASIQVDASDLSLPATVTHIAPTATISSGVVNYAVTVEVQSVSEDASLRQGMTVTVSLIVSNQQNVLLVPYAAITTERGQKYVQVVLPDGTIENRAITTGTTDYQYTEVTEGISEGEQILVSPGIISESETSEQDERQQNGMMVPGMMDGGGPPSGGPPSGGFPGG